MIKNINLAEDFIYHMSSYWQSLYIGADTGGTISGNATAWNENYKAFRVNDAASTSKGSINIPLGYVKAGDIIEVECEVMNVSGVKSKIAVDSYSNGDYAVGFGNIGIKQSLFNNNFEILKNKFIVPTSCYAMVAIGVYTVDIGDYYIRNIKIKTENDKNTNDTGWLVLPLTGGAVAYGSDTIPLYKKIGNVVEIVGAIKGLTNINSTTAIIFTNLPSGFRPINPIPDVSQGSGPGKWLLSINTNGNITGSRYSENGSSYKTTMDGNEWLPFHAIFTV